MPNIGYSQCAVFTEMPEFGQKSANYSGTSSYDRLDIRTTWVTTKILVLTYDQILSYDPHGGQGQNVRL
jgi:hypothetical protein